MIPAITPPTDNLYKFISLFGLAIFLFAMYNLGFVYDQSTSTKMQIEDLKAEVQSKEYENSNQLDKELNAESSDNRFRPSRMNELTQELKIIENIIMKAKLATKDKILFLSKVSKLNIGLDTLWLKKVGCFSSLGLGIFSMFIGFWYWHRKEQALRDKILIIEHKLKKKEKRKEKEIKIEVSNSSTLLQSIDSEEKSDESQLAQET
jgi:hypothetical protein